MYTRRICKFQAKRFTAVFKDVDAGPLSDDGLDEDNVRLKFRTFECRRSRPGLQQGGNIVRSILRRVVCQSIFAMAVVAALASTAFAQDANIRSVTLYTIKPDRVGDFQAAVKEYDAILAKSGSERYASTWVSLMSTRALRITPSGRNSMPRPIRRRRTRRETWRASAPESPTARKAHGGSLMR